MNKVLDKRNNGITLVALVITIIILLILAGITISALTGNNGLITRAKQAADETKYANAAEKVKLAVNASYDETGTISDEKLKENLNNIDGINPQVTEVTYDLTVIVDGYEFSIKKTGQVVALGRTNNLPENPPQTDAGTEVALKDGWGTQSVSYIKTSDGTEVKELTTVSTVYAVSVGNGEAVPVPYGFYYVGGNFDTGVIISDNEADKYDGVTDKTTWEYTTSLQGNQFVWIPCETSEYVKTSWGTSYRNANWETTTERGEMAQIEKYGGFYVGRYEAGLASTINEFTTTQKHTGSNQICNLDGVPQSKAGVIPWMFIDWTHAKSNAESMYNNDKYKNYVSSGLITGTQWDVMLNKIVEKTELTSSDLTSSSKWGNYRNTQINYKGRLAKAYVSSSSWYLPAFGEETEGTTRVYSSDDTYGDLLTTGASNVTEQYHIFDVAGNLWEWTEEDSHYATSGQYRVIRGGACNNAYATIPACYRSGTNTVSRTSFNIGFRAVLYIK